MEAGFERPDADQRPQGVHPRLARRRLVEDQRFQLCRGRGAVPFGQQPLGHVAVEDIRTVQPLDQLVVALLRQIEAGRRGVSL